MEHIGIDDQKWTAGSPEQFTGETRVKALKRLTDGVGPSVIEVWFAAGARTYWHSHPEGQTLWVVAGKAVVGTAAGERAVAHPGEVVNCPAGERHWHGALSDGPMLHISVTTGGSPEWAQEVTEEEYGG